jgi:glycosyltransferase involved in cell wall biosynthesis
MLTVVMATCEGERFVDQQLDSIVRQLGPADEVVVSDDASTDATVDIIRAMGDSRVRVLINPARVGYLRNFGRALAEARGTHIFFSDQDDVWLPEKVSTLTAALERSACVASDAVVVDEQLQVLSPSYFALRRAQSFSALGILLRPPIVGATMACEAGYLRKLLPFPAGVPHDFWITFNAALDGALETVRQPLILYRRHTAAVSLSATGRKRAHAKIVAERVKLLSAWVQRRRSNRML